MAFAIFYNSTDLNAIAAQVSATLANNYDSFLTTQQRNTVKQTFNRCWQNGLSGWASAPLAGAQSPNDGDADARIIAVNSSQVTKQNLIDALRIIGNNVPAAQVPSAPYMLAIANDLQGTAIEPWG